MKGNQKSDGITSGFLWGFGERISAQVVSFVVSIILARLLEPSHYGAIAIVNIFITLANVFVSSGLGNALIQKKNSDEKDFSTVLYCNLFISVVFYGLVFVSAPFIANLYKLPELVSVLRVMGISLPISAFNNVQHSYVSKKMLFKRFFFSTIGGTIISAIVGIVLAYYGFGIWALVAQFMTNKIIDTVILFITVKWRPKLLFDFLRLKQLFVYGWKLLVSELINTGYIELRSLIVGVKYSANDLAYYNRGQSFPKLFISNINTSLQSVLFPAMSNIQDEKEKIKNLTRRAIKCNSYIVTPIVVGLALVARPFIQILLTDKWLPCVPFLQIYCVFYVFMPIQAACLQVIKATGRSDIYLKLEILKKLVGILLLLISMPFGAFAIAFSAVISNVFGALINVIPTKKILNYNYREQISDYLHGIIPLLCMVAVCLLMELLPLSSFALLILQALFGAGAYIFVSHLLKLEAYVYMIKKLKPI